MRFLFVDRIVQSSPGELIRGLKHVTKEDSCLTVDEQGRPCFISSLIGETLGQLAAWNVMTHNQFTQRPVAGVVASVCVKRPVYVGETVLLESFIDSLDSTAVEYHSEARVGDEPVFIIDGALGPLLPMEQFSDPCVVRQQYEEIYRPGDWASVVDIQKQVIPRALDVSNDVLRYSKFTFDQVIELEPGVSLVAVKKISRAAPYFPDHFPKKPVLPMTVLLECIQNLARQFIAVDKQYDKYQIKEMRRIKMNDFVMPGDVIIGRMTLRHHTEEQLIILCRCEVDGKRVCVVELVLESL